MIRSSRRRSQSMTWPAGFGSGSTEDAAEDAAKVLYIGPCVRRSEAQRSCALRGLLRKGSGALICLADSPAYS